MKIKVIQEREDGTYEFTANLTEAQHKFLLEFAIQDLLRKGLSVPIMGEDDEVVSIVNMKDDDEDPNSAGRPS